MAAYLNFLRNNYFDARNFFDNAGNPQAPLRQNQFGFELGGPVVLPKLYDGRNRTFFMVSYQGLRNTQSNAGQGFTLSDLQRNGDFSELCTTIPGASFNSSGICSDPSGQIHDPTGAPYTNNLIPTGQRSSQAQAALQYMPMPIFLSQG